MIVLGILLIIKTYFLTSEKKKINDLEHLKKNLYISGIDSNFILENKILVIIKRNSHSSDKDYILSNPL